MVAAVLPKRALVALALVLAVFCAGARVIASAHLCFALNDAHLSQDGEVELARVVSEAQHLGAVELLLLTASAEPSASQQSVTTDRRAAVLAYLARQQVHPKSHQSAFSPAGKSSPSACRSGEVAVEVEAVFSHALLVK